MVIFHSYPTVYHQIRLAVWVSKDLCRGGELFDRIAQGDLGGEAQAWDTGRAGEVLTMAMRFRSVESHEGVDH